ncbi:MAG: formimidoylglutamate deiminase, partial [Nocardioides sp.]
VDLESPRTAGTGGDEVAAVFAATAEDVVSVIADGRLVTHRDERPDIGRALAREIERLWS